MRHRAGWVFPALLFGTILFPSAAVHVFDGIPSSTLPEFLALCAVFPLLVSGGLRRLAAERLLRGQPRRLVLFVAGSLAVVAVKSFLIFSGAQTGFHGCYSTPLSPPPSRPCESSFENPFFRFEATRLDRTIDFAESTWNLSFVNSLRFNFYPEPGNPSRDRLPLKVRWSGAIRRPVPGRLRVNYVGSGRVSVGAQSKALAPSYGSAGSLELDLAAGRHDVTIDYDFDDGYRHGGPGPRGPYAAIRVEESTPKDPRRWLPARALPAPFPFRILGLLADAWILGWLFALLVLYLSLLRRDWPIAALFLLLGMFGSSVHTEVPGLGRDAVVVFALWAVTAALGFSYRSRSRLLGTVLIFALTALRPTIHELGLGQVHSRRWASDWLTYESYGRSILETGSLEAGEKVFYQVPLSRYLNFLEHFLLGDGDTLPTFSRSAALHLALFWFLTRLRPAKSSPRRKLLILASAGLLILLLNTRPVPRLVRDGASETATWIALPCIAALLLVGRSPRGWPAGCLLIGLSIAFRPNQAPALALLWLAFLLRAVSIDARRALGASVLTLLAALLPALHNAYFGHRLVLFTTTASHPATLTIKPTALLDMGTRGELRERLSKQLLGLLGFTESGKLNPVCPGLLLVWLLAIALLWKTGVRRSPSPVLVAALPIAYLSVHVFYDVYVYYPRHIIAGYLAMGIAAAWIAAESPQRAQAGSARDSSAPKAAFESPL